MDRSQASWIFHRPDECQKNKKKKGTDLVKAPASTSTVVDLLLVASWSGRNLFGIVWALQGVEHVCPQNARLVFISGATEICTQ